MLTHLSRWPLSYSPIIVTLALSAATNAATLTWNGTTGSAATAAKWSPAQQPAATDDLVFSAGSGFTVTFDSAVPASNSHLYRNSVSATLSLTSPHAITADLDIGNFSADNATVHLAAGVLSVGGLVTLGDLSNSAGTLTIDGIDASLSITGAASDLIVGRAGSGTLVVSGGGEISIADDFIMASTSFSSGEVTVTGGSGTFRTSLIETTSDTTGNITVANNGAAQLHLLSGGRVHSARDVRIATNSGATGSIDLSGTFSFLGSRLIVDHNLDLSRNDLAPPGGTADLTIATSTLVNVGNATRIGDPNGGTATVHLAGGVLTSPTVDIQSNGTITGFGTINGNVTNLGHITPTGVTGITINGILFNETSNQLTGTKFTFGPGGGYTGSGTCATFISGDVTSVITATGPLTMGVGAVGGFTFAGTIDVGAQLVTLVNTIDARLNGPVHVNGGVLSGTNGIGIQPDGKLDGHGTIGGGLHINGELDPHDDGPLGGEFLIQGNLTFNPIAKFDIELGGPPATGNFDHVSATQATFLDGELRIRLKNGFVPRVGDQYVIVSAVGGRSNQFATITPPSPAACNSATFDVLYTPTSAILTVRPPAACSELGDVNADGKLDGADIQPFINTIFSATYNPCADLNSDCQSTPPDLQAFITALLT